MEMKISIRGKLNLACLVSFRCLLTVSYPVESILSVESPQVYKSLTAEISTVQYCTDLASRLWATQCSLPSPQDHKALHCWGTALHCTLHLYQCPQFTFVSTKCTHEELLNAFNVWDGGPTICMGMTVWQYDSKTAWQYDSVTVWQRGSMTVRQYDSVTVWQYDSVTVRRFDSKTVWQCNSMSRQYDIKTHSRQGSMTLKGKCCSVRGIQLFLLNATMAANQLPSSIITSTLPLLSIKIAKQHPRRYVLEQQ